MSSPKGNYNLEISLPGFQTQVLDGSKIGPGPLRIQMELRPVEEVATATIAAPPPTAEPAATARVRIGGQIAPPKVITRTDPVYPTDAREAGVEGAVVVSALIDKDGSVKNAVPLSGHRLLRDAAVACVSQWVYRPARVNGEPWPMRLSTTVVFTLQRIE